MSDNDNHPEMLVAELSDLFAGWLLDKQPPLALPRHIPTENLRQTQHEFSQIFSSVPYF